MNLVSLVRASLLVFALMVANTSPARGQAQRTLYERLGGYNGISALVDDFADRLIADQPSGEDDARRARDHRRRIRNVVGHLSEAPDRQEI
jgi:hypothetical protein